MAWPGTAEKGVVLELDDAQPRPAAGRLVALQLGPLGVSELQAYIGELRQEIARAEAEIARKAAHRSSADAFFRAPKPE